jgi:hypothetical protein
MAEFDDIPHETLIELGKTAMRLSRNKETRRDFLKAIKKVAPDYTLPGDQQVEDLRQELADERAANEAKATGDAVKARLEKQRAGLLDGTLIPGRKFDEAAVKEIEEKVMPRYGLSDYEAGAKLYAADLKPARQTTGLPSAGASWTLPDLPGLLDNPAKAALEAAHGVIDELRGRAA